MLAGRARSTGNTSEQIRLLMVLLQREVCYRWPDATDVVVLAQGSQMVGKVDAAFQVRASRGSGMSVGGSGRTFEEAFEAAAEMCAAEVSEVLERSAAADPQGGM